MRRNPSASCDEARACQRRTAVPTADATPRGPTEWTVRSSTTPRWKSATKRARSVVSAQQRGGEKRGGERTAQRLSALSLSRRCGRVVDHGGGGVRDSVLGAGCGLATRVHPRDVKWHSLTACGALCCPGWLFVAGRAKMIQPYATLVHERVRLWNDGARWIRTAPRGAGSRYQLHRCDWLRLLADVDAC
jgi:hypothetical protein